MSENEQLTALARSKKKRGMDLNKGALFCMGFAALFILVFPLTLRESGAGVQGYQYREAWFAAILAVIILIIRAITVMKIGDPLYFKEELLESKHYLVIGSALFFFVFFFVFGDSLIVEGDPRTGGFTNMFNGPVTKMAYYEGPLLYCSLMTVAYLLELAGDKRHKEAVTILKAMD